MAVTGRQPTSLQAFTVFGGLNGTLYTATGGALQLVGQFTYTQPYEILGYTAMFISGYDFSVIPFSPPLGTLAYNVTGKYFGLPSPYGLGPAFTNAICIMQAESTYVPSTAFGTAVNRVVGTAMVSHTFQPGSSIYIDQGQSVSTYVRVPGTTQTDEATMITTLYVNVLPTGG